MQIRVGGVYRNGLKKIVIIAQEITDRKTPYPFIASNGRNYAADGQYMLPAKDSEGNPVVKPKANQELDLVTEIKSPVKLKAGSPVWYIGYEDGKVSLRNVLGVVQFDTLIGDSTDEVPVKYDGSDKTHMYKFGLLNFDPNTKVTK